MQKYCQWHEPKWSVCHLSVTLLSFTQRVELFSNIFAPSNCLGTGHFVLKFWQKIRRGRLSRLCRVLRQWRNRASVMPSANVPIASVTTCRPDCHALLMWSKLIFTIGGRFRWVSPGFIRFRCNDTLFSFHGGRTVDDSVDGCRVQRAMLDRDALVSPVCYVTYFEVIGTFADADTLIAIWYIPASIIEF